MRRGRLNRGSMLTSAHSPTPSVMPHTTPQAVTWFIGTTAAPPAAVRGRASADRRQCSRTSPATITTTPAGVLYALAASARVDSISRMIHGAATPSRAAFTIQDCRASTSARMATSLAERGRQVAQHGGEFGSTDLAGHPQRLEDAIGHRIGEPRLQSVHGDGEVAGGDVVPFERARSPPGSLPARLWARVTTLSGSDSPLRTAETRWSTASGQFPRVARRRAWPAS